MSDISQDRTLKAERRRKGFFLFAIACGRTDPTPQASAATPPAVSLAPEPMIRRLGLIYRKDKGLSKAAMGFIQVIIDHAGDSDLQNPAVKQEIIVGE